MSIANVANGANCTIFKKFLGGGMPPNPPSKRVASPRAAWGFAPCKYPHFSRKMLNPPPPEMKS